MFCHRKFGAQKRRENRGPKDRSQNQQQEHSEDQTHDETKQQPETTAQKQEQTQQIEAPAISQQPIINTNQYPYGQQQYNYQVPQPQINTGTQNAYHPYAGSNQSCQNLCPPPNPQSTQLQYGQTSNIYTPPPPPQSYPSYNPQYPSSYINPPPPPYKPEEQQQDYGQNTLISTNYVQQPPIMTNYYGMSHSSYIPQPPAANQMSTSHSQPISQQNLVQSSYGSYHSYNQAQNIQNTYVQPSVVQPQNIVNTYISPSIVQPQNIQNTYVSPSVVQPQILNQQQQQFDSNYSGQSTNNESSSPILKKEISSLVESQLITVQNEELKITEIKPSPETHKIIIIKDKEFVFPIVPYKEQNQDEFTIQFTEAPGIVVCQQNIELQGFEYADRQCSKHNTNVIEHVCLEEQCKSSNLLCSKCIKNHKSHNFIELQEILYCVKSRQDQLNEKDELVNKMQKQSAKYFKIVKSKVMQQLADIEQKFNEGYEELKQQLLAWRDIYKNVMTNLIEGGLTSLKEAVSKVLAQDTLDTSSSNLELKGFISKFEDATQSLAIYRKLVFEKKDRELLTVNIEDTELHINANLITNYDDLDQQIKIQVVKKNLSNILYKEFLWLKDNEAIKLQGNTTALSGEAKQKIQIISYSPL